MQKIDASHHSAITKVAYDWVIKSPAEWYQHLRQVLYLFREEILENKSSFDLTELNYTESNHGINPEKFRVLLTMLLENYPRTNTLSKPINTIGQLISLNSKKFYRPSRANNSADGLVSRNSRGDEEFIPDYF